MRLTKHHGLGNDFLVALLDDEPRDLPGLARAVCDRRRGVGADGLIIGVSSADPAVDAVMVLHNSDGSRAEMSGNGIRCLAHAIAMERGVGAVELRIATDGGIRVVQVDGDGPVAAASVDMGEVGDGPGIPAVVASRLGGRVAATADLGNPHLVVRVDDPATVDVACEGRELEAHYPQGMNVHFVAATPGEADALDLRVWERGAGVTEACGTGAVAAATRAAQWGLVGEDVTVHMPGGDVRVRVGHRATLVGPAVYIATVDWPTGDVAE
jgi:diaminopimelate epimerase